jgi:hypothetical protein
VGDDSTKGGESWRILRACQGAEGEGVGCEVSEWSDTLCSPWLQPPQRAGSTCGWLMPETGPPGYDLLQLLFNTPDRTKCCSYGGFLALKCLRQGAQAAVWSRGPYSHGLSSVEREKGEVNNSFQLAGERALLPGD